MAVESPKCHPFGFRVELARSSVLRCPLVLVKERCADVCECLKRLGYSRNNQVRLYGQVFYLVSDPVKVNDHLVFVEAWEPKTQQNQRVSIPLNLIRMAEKAAA